MSENSALQKLSEQYGTPGLLPISVVRKLLGPQKVSVEQLLRADTQKRPRRPTADDEIEVE